MTWQEGPGWMLYRGDSRDMHTLADASARLVLTSPPYFSTETEPLLKVPRAKQTDVARVRAEVAAYALSLGANFQEIGRVVCPAGYLVVHTRDIRYGRTLVQLASLHRQLAEAVGFELRTRVFWRRTPTARSRSKTFAEHAFSGAFEVDDLDEFLVFQKSGEERALARKLSRKAASKLAEPMWEFRPMGGARSHPYQSPAEAMRRFIELLTREGDLVVDPFAGHATTLWCAVKLGRNAVGWEIDERHFRAAVLKMRGVLKQ